MDNNLTIGGGVNGTYTSSGHGTGTASGPGGGLVWAYWYHDNNGDNNGNKLNTGKNTFNNLEVWNDMGTMLEIRGNRTTFFNMWGAGINDGQSKWIVFD